MRKTRGGTNLSFGICFYKAGIVCFLNTVQETMFEGLSLTGSRQAEEEHRKSERRKTGRLGRKGGQR